MEGVALMTQFPALEDGVFVAPQIAQSTLPALKADGVTTLVSNRVDGEEPGAPRSADIADWAAAEGMQFHHLPVYPGQLTADTVRGMSEALASAPGGVLVFCKSGGRSAALWAVTRAAEGRLPPEALVEAAGQAGYDLRALTEMLRGAAEQGLP